LPNGEIALAINRGGSLELVTISPDGRTTVTGLVDGINPGKVAIVADGAYAGGTSDLSIYYARDNEVREHVRRGDDWTSAMVVVAGETADQPLAQGGFLGSDDPFSNALAARAGASILLAIKLGPRWQTAVVSASGTIGTAMDLTFYSVPTATYLVGATLFQASFDGVNEPVPENLGDIELDESGPAGLCYNVADSRVYYEAHGCVWGQGDPITPVTPCWADIEHLFCGGYSEIFVQPTSAVVGHYTPYSRAFEYLPIAADTADVDSLLFAGPGFLFEDSEYISPVDDPFGDGVDRNCDGFD
jgi:hypothetical protein